MVEGELGLVDQMWESVAVARAAAMRLRIPFGLLVLDGLVLPWLAMAGRFAEGEAMVVEIDRLNHEMTLDEVGEATAQALLSLRVWQGRGAEVAPIMLGLQEAPMAMSAVVVAQLLRAGLDDQARAHLAAHPVRLAEDDWFAMLNWGSAAEVALAFGDVGLGAAAYERLAPHAGRTCGSGSANALGPVDAFLALAARAVGETALATRHADRSEELTTAWRIPLAGAWLRDHRRRYAF